MMNATVRCFILDIIFTFLFYRFDGRGDTEGAQISASKLVGSQYHPIDISGRIAAVTPTAVYTATRLGVHPLSPIPEQTWHSAVPKLRDTTADYVPTTGVQHRCAIAGDRGR